MLDLVYLVPLIPLLGFLTLGLFGKAIKKELVIGIIGSSAVGLSFLVTALIFFDMLSNPLSKAHIVPIYQWFEAGGLNVSISYQIDQLSILFALVVTGVGFLIHIYSMGYMKGDRSFYRFFAYLNLFIFMMLNLVLSSNFLLTFLGWEGVGLCSYLLIGFWYDRKFEGVRIKWTGDAGNKAFIVNRIGDFGFLIAMFLIYVTFNSLDYVQVMDAASESSKVLFGTGTITAITLLLFLGCTGKSAQLPLAVWLPDAMAGPTPVSALIHAATMVTAGVFLVARSSILFALSPAAMTVVAVVGVATAFFAATIGIVQNDIKKVLAYSTVSQLGFMFAALGVGAFTAGVFHVMTHAFFKGLLFLGAGAVIHGLHEEQNIKRMGNLRKYMPKTYITFFIATLAISGIPFFSGFFSKDEILWHSFSDGNSLLWLILSICAFFTAFYMFRLLYLVFFGKERFNTRTVHPHESPASMTVPLIILAALSALGGFLGVPEPLGAWFSDSPHLLHSWLAPLFQNSEIIIKNAGAEASHSLTMEYLLILISVAVAIAGIMLARKYYSDENWTKPRQLASTFKPIYSALYHKYRLDEIYAYLVVDPIFNSSQKFLWRVFDMKFIDGIVNGTAKVTVQLGEYIRRFQFGLVQNYALVMLAGIVLILFFLLF